MSMYASSSEQYWKSRRKSSFVNQTKHLIILFTILTTITCLIVKNSYQKRRQQQQHRYDQQHHRNQLLLVRPNATKTQQLKCTSHFQSNDNNNNNNNDYCPAICQNERKSLPRPTMYQSCLQGCLSSFPLAAIIGCSQQQQQRQQDDESYQKQQLELVFQKVGSRGVTDCHIYKNMQPKPEVFSTCRKYHRVGSRMGYETGGEFIEKVVEEEWRAAKERYLKEENERDV